MVDIDIVMVNYKTYDLAQKFLDTFYKFKPSTPHRLMVVDNESDTSKLYGLNLYDSIAFPVDQNLGYAKACNFASVGDSTYIGIFNSDIEFVNNTCIDQCVSFLEENPEVGIVGPFQYSTNKGGRRVTNAGILGPGSKPKHRGWMEPDKGQYRFNDEVLMIMGSAMIIRRDLWSKIHNDKVFRSHFPNALGAMPETELYYEDTTLCYAAPKFGYKVFYLGEEGFDLIHQWHQTIKDDPKTGQFQRSREIFRKLMDDWGIERD